MNDVVSRSPNSAEAGWQRLSATRMFDLSGQVIIVTGAASGLGLAIAEVLNVNGARVTLIDIDSRHLHESAALWTQRGLPVEAVVLDVTDSQALGNAIDGVVTRYGRLDAVFANAGISAGPGFGTDAGQASGCLERIDLTSWDRVLAVNLTAVMQTMQAAAVHMKRSGAGRIIVTASIAGVRAEPFVGYAYAAAKAGVINLVRQAAVELAPHGVLVNAIAPGFMHTDIGGGRLHDAAVRNQLAAQVPLGRVAEADEIQGLALFLASAASSYLSGVVIPVDGGVLAC